MKPILWTCLEIRETIKLGIKRYEVGDSGTDVEKMERAELLDLIFKRTKQTQSDNISDLSLV